MVFWIYFKTQRKEKKKTEQNTLNNLLVLFLLVSFSAQPFFRSEPFFYSHILICIFLVFSLFSLFFAAMQPNPIIPIQRVRTLS